MPLLDRITIEPGKCGGKPCVRGMRVRVIDVLALLSEGLTASQIVEEFPYLEVDDVYACAAYAAGELERTDRKPA